MTDFDLSPLVISLKTVALSIVFTFFLGLYAAKAVWGVKNRVLQSLLDAFFTLPLVLPPTVAGFFLLYIFGVRGVIGKALLDFFAYKIVFTWSATVLASTVIAFPLMYRSSLAALSQVDKNLIYAGRTLGMSEARIFFRVTLPAASHGILSGLILSFARALGEFGATAMIAGNIAGKTRTAPLAIYSAAGGGDMKTAGFYTLIIVVISFIAVFLLSKFHEGKG